MQREEEKARCGEEEKDSVQAFWLAQMKGLLQAR